LKHFREYEISYLPSDYGRRDQCPQVGWRQAQEGKCLASGLELVPLAPVSRPAVGLHLRLRHRTESVQAVIHQFSFVFLTVVEDSPHLCSVCEFPLWFIFLQTVNVI
jgi:hypothetical protein